MANPTNKSYDGIITWATGSSNDIQAKNLITARNIKLTNSSNTQLASASFNGTADATLKLAATVPISISGNAATATTATTATTSTTATSATTATTATKLGTNAGSAYIPVYFSGGVPVACTLCKAPISPTSSQITNYPDGAMWIEV